GKSAKEENDNDHQNGTQNFCNRSVTENQNGTGDKPFSSSHLAALEKTAKEENVDEQKNAATVTKTSSPSAGQEETAKGRIGQGVYAQVKGEDIVIRLADRTYRIRGLDKNLSFDLLKVNIRVNVGERYHIDTLDLYHARQRESFIKTASEELEVNAEEIKSDLGRVLLKLEEMQEEQIQRTLKPQKPQIMLNEAERAQATALLQDPHLMERIGEDFRYCGLVGEEVNAQVGYVCATSRKLDEPLALIIQASSAAGKTSLMDMILSFMPPEEKVKYTAMTGQSLFYMGQDELVHKILAISEEEGMEQAKYAIKTMQSEKQLCIASTGKDPKSGKLTTHEYRVDGPAQIMLTSTAAEIDEELQNRCIVLTANENREQTQAIHQRQRERETLKGMLWRGEQDKIRRLHQNAQRLLRPLMVVNPFAPQLTFLDSRLRMRRDHAKYLTLIRAVALLHQYQRQERKVTHQGQVIPYIEVDVKDIEIANRLANHVMGTSLDELAPQTRRLLELMQQMVKEGCREKQVEQTKFHFTRKDVRDYTAWGNTQLKVHLDRLVDLEYLLTHYGRNGQRYVYELAYRGEGDNRRRFMMGLIDVEKLGGNGNSNYGQNLSG
ncbi:MAG: DNA primase, partial [Nitrospirota bacterium]